MLASVLEAVLARLDGQLPGRDVVVAATHEGQALRVRRDTGGLPGSVSVALEVPLGRVRIVLCKWMDEPDVLAYISLDGGARRPEWSQLEPTPEGVDLVVKWAPGQRPRCYRFHWLPDAAEDAPTPA